jgi:anti-sigma factor ChrR (cupin superfamily)
VLSGIFSDHSGDYQAGSYLRNPEGYKHAPFSKEGCVLFVKLHQFAQGDDEHIVIDTKKIDWSLGIGGLSVMPLYSYQGESTALVKWPKEERFQAHQHFGGEEVFVISGEFIDEHGRYPQGTWIRSPHLSQHCPYVEQETIILVKVGHLLK